MLIFCHLHVGNSHCQTQLLHLVLDSEFHLIGFGHHVLIMVGHQGRELANLIQSWAPDSWDVIDQRL